MLHRVVVEYKAGSVETTAKRTIVTDNADGSRSKLTKTVCETLKVCLFASVLSFSTNNSMLAVAICSQWHWIQTWEWRCGNYREETAQSTARCQTNRHWNQITTYIIELVLFLLSNYKQSTLNHSNNQSCGGTVGHVQCAVQLRHVRVRMEKQKSGDVRQGLMLPVRHEFVAGLKKPWQPHTSGSTGSLGGG